MKRIKLLLALAALMTSTALAGCSDPETAVRVAEAHGFRDVEVTGWSAFSCSEDDTFSTGFEATNVEGQRVSGTVCSNLLVKGATLRLD